MLRTHSDIELETYKAIEYVKKSGLPELNRNDRMNCLKTLTK